MSTPTSSSELTSDLPSRLSWVGSVFSTAFKKQIAYRVDFWIQFGSVIFGSVGLAYVLWSGIYSNQGATTLGGYTLQGMIFYYAFTPVIQRLMNGTDWGLAAEEIYSGTLTRYLIYPVSFFMYKYVQRIASSLVSVLQYGSFILIYAWAFGVPAETHITAQSVMLGFFIALLGGLFYFFIQLCLEAVAFWQDSVWSLLVMLRFSSMFLGGAVLPITLFPESLRKTLVLTPFPHLISLPIRTILGQSSQTDVLLGIEVLAFWIVLSLILMRLIWRQGLRTYAGVGQ